MKMTLALKLIELAIDVTREIIKENDDDNTTKEEKIEKMRNMRERLEDLEWDLE